jgi:TRAP transporter TAXI family solute receptor
MPATHVLIAACVGTAALALANAPALAQTYGYATLPPGTLNHTTASAIAKVMKERAGMNVLVQPMAGGTAIVPMVGRGEVEIGATNIMEPQEYYEDRGFKNLRLITAINALRTPFFVRKDSGIRTIADLKGKRVSMGYSAMRSLDVVARAILATGGLTENDVKPVLVPNVVRSADDFVAGNADMFFFAFGAAKIREVDVSVGGIRVLEIDPAGMPAARKIMPWGYLTDAAPGPVFTGVDKPMKIYSFDNILITHAGVPDEFIYKMLATMEKYKEEMMVVQPVLREFTGPFAYKEYGGVPYHSGAVKYFKEKGLSPTKLQ